jgi:hypothetical protein
MKRPTPMKTEQANNGLYPAVDDDYELGDGRHHDQWLSLYTKNQHIAAKM